MKKQIYPLFIALILLIAGCGGDDGGTNGNGNGDEGPLRFVVDTTAARPTLSSPGEAVWSQVDSIEIEIGGSSTYGINPNLGNQDVLMKAIKKDDTLYLWFRWHDASPNIWANYLITNRVIIGDDTTIQWTNQTFVGDDKFLLVFADSTNGDEWANCATMCHTTHHATTGGGNVDAINWMATKTAPGKMAEDQYWTGAAATLDNTINDYVYRRNWNGALAQPNWMHEDDTAFHGTVLYLTDTLTFNGFLDWEYRDSLPGYAIDSTIYHRAGNRSMWDVKAVSHYDNTGPDPANYIWLVVMARALDTGHDDDIDLSNLDSIQVSIAATHNADRDPDGGTMTAVNHSGSEPFWLILKP